MTEPEYVTEYTYPRYKNIAYENFKKGDYLGQRIVERERYDCIYDEFDNCSLLIGYKLHKGYKVFAVTATYATMWDVSTYYYAAKNAKMARKIHNKLYGSTLPIIQSVRECGKDEAERVLGSPYELA